MDTKQIGPVNVWPLASHLADEMIARNWTCVDVATRMPGDYGHNIILVNLLMAVQDEKMIIADDIFSGLASAFGISKEYFSRLHGQWLHWPDAREPFDCPEHLLDGLLIPENDNAVENPRQR